MTDGTFTFVRWGVGLALIAVFAGVAIMNVMKFVSSRRGVGGSIFPFVGGLCGVLGILIQPYYGLWPYWWSALVLDIGCIPAIVGGISYRLWVELKSCAKRPSASTRSQEVEYPVFVLSFDDRTFQRVNDERGLRYYEQPDLEEGPHYAWDSQGRRFVVQWNHQARRPQLCLVNEDGIESFQEAIEEYSRATATWKGRSLPRRLCDPANLEREILQMTYHKEAAAYQHLKDSGQGPVEVMRAVRAAGGNDIACIRVARLLFGLSLAEVKKPLFESHNPDCSFDEHQERIAGALEKILEEEREQQGEGNP